MTRFALILSAFLGLLLMACGGGDQSKGQGEQNGDDIQAHLIHSAAQPAMSVVTHLFLDAEVDFTSHQVRGWAHYDLQNSQNADRVVFDTKALNVKRVLVDSAEVSDWWIGEDQGYLGSPLEIKIEPASKSVSIEYESSPSAEAIFWLDQGEKPFMFTQSQAILARTWLPCQDSPGIRYTYNAKIKVPEGLMALMSAENPTEVDSSGVYTFKMDQPIPSYLMALAAGDIVYQKIGRNTGVYAEPDLIEASAYEFEDMQAMLNSAEKIYGKYAWEQYDLLVLPPSFPFGGMENPRLTFATPTILAGDKSLTALVAHELAHSWSGNLVTNASWNDFWLNEGFTVYFERRIMEDVYGKDYADMLSILGEQDLVHTISEMGEDSEDTKLKLALEGRNPDDGMTDIAYEKGFFFLKTLEQSMGREAFDAFLNKHFTENAFKTIDTETFLDNLKRDLLGGDEGKYADLQIQEWVYEPGIPNNAYQVKSVLFDQVNAELDSFLTNDQRSANDIDTAGWTTHQWLYFLRNLPTELDAEIMKDLDNAYGFTNTGNAEIACEWFCISLNNSYDKAYPNIEAFLKKVGRRKFLVPLYSAMIQNPETKEMAAKVYNESRSGYHAVATLTLDEMLNF